MGNQIDTLRAYATVAASWLVRLPAHRWLTTLRTDVDDFVMGCQLQASDMEHALDNLGLNPAWLVGTRERFTKMLNKFAEDYVRLQSVCVSFAADEPVDVEDEPEEISDNADDPQPVSPVSRQRSPRTRNPSSRPKKAAKRPAASG